MEQAIIVQQKEPRIRDVLLPSAVVVAASFFQSVPFGICIAMAVAVFIAAFTIHTRAASKGAQPVVLEIRPDALVIKRRWIREVDIAWQDIEAVRLSRGRRGAIKLDIRVTTPGRYLGRFMRANLVMSWHQISLRVSGLALSPKEIALAIEDARKSFLGHNVIEIIHTRFDQ